MSRISVLHCVVLLSVLLCIDLAQTFELSSHGQKEASPMWFGPRIGRKKRNNGEKVYRNEKEPALGLLDVLRDSPLVVVAVNEANKQHNFTPRLGRESGENSPNWIEDIEVDSDAIVRPSNPFAPRLGRTSYNTFSPRLGRESEVNVPLK
ncbi:PBAN-type neuropeptides-like isoform X2 [Anthonomus grandis grandis]|uniref:PBAN-type neuropeptides-like isoform X2 n=1 Tax=Anthonomus grandis grandis TaxID=2921223 RepID=UPI0021663D6C|nr:PBAN-type neuropeptides-like isoform X2 [Anthonomus grandis grandis]